MSQESKHGGRPMTLKEIAEAESPSSADRSTAIHEHDCPTAWAFFNKHSLGSKLPPSCLVCGDAPADVEDIAIRHMELPNVIVCRKCRDAATSSAPSSDAAIVPIPMVLYCPACGAQHVDEPDERTPGWTNPPHKSHLCHACRCIWRPADVPTVGVEKIETHGKADTWSPFGQCPAEPHEHKTVSSSIARVEGPSDECRQCGCWSRSTGCCK